jgi:iron complex outermembrane receptor protein
MYKKHLLITAILASWAAVAQNAAAQQAKPAGPAVQGLDEIVITAERRSQSLQSVPLAVTAVSGEDLSDRGVTSANDLTKLVPAVTFGEGGGGITQLFDQWFFFRSRPD